MHLSVKGRGAKSISRASRPILNINRCKYKCSSKWENLSIQLLSAILDHPLLKTINIQGDPLNGVALLWCPIKSNARVRFCTVAFSGQVTFYKVWKSHSHVSVVTLYLKDHFSLIIWKCYQLIKFTQNPKIVLYITSVSDPFYFDMDPDPDPAPNPT